MTTVASVLWGFLGGIGAWFVTSLIAQPLTAFLAARSGAAHALALYANYDYYDPERDQPSADVVCDRARLLAEAGADLIAFDHANYWLSGILRRVKWFPGKAGNQMILLSQMKPYGVQNDQVRQEVMRYLRLGKRFGAHDRI